ncbi:MAG: dihydroorotate dehydrogenase-like protein [Planctomycetota bacterium]
MVVDLSTRYLGMELKNPLVASAGPLTWELDTLKKLEDAGASAAVFPSLFEEQIEHEEMELHNYHEFQAYSNAESLTQVPEAVGYKSGADEYLERFEQAKKSVSIPLIGSLNGWTDGGWVRYARLIEQAGADALELNIYFVPTDATATAADIEKQYVELVKAVSETISIPLSVKIGQNFTSLPHFARQLQLAGADGLVLFNRYLEADIDLDTLEYRPDLVLSNRHEARVPIRWIGILRDEVDISLAATSGVHRWQGAVKLLLAGADVTMMTSVLLMKGPAHLSDLLSGLTQWVIENEYESVQQLQGSMSRGNYPDPGALERANYMQALVSYSSD